MHHSSKFNKPIKKPLYITIHKDLNQIVFKHKKDLVKFHRLSKFYLIIKEDLNTTKFYIKDTHFRMLTKPSKSFSMKMIS